MQCLHNTVSDRRLAGRKLTCTFTRLYTGGTMTTLGSLAILMSVLQNSNVDIAIAHHDDAKEYLMASQYL